MILARHLQHTHPLLGDFGKFFDAAFRRFNEPDDGLRFLADDESWTLELDVPGVTRDAIQLEVKDQHLHLSIGHEGAFPVRALCRLPLTEQVEVAGIAACLENGVLSIRLPKRARAEKAKRIEIL